MARSAMLEVDVVASHELSYDLEASPLSTQTNINDQLSPNPSNAHFNATQPSSSTQPSRDLSPSIRLLFSLISPRDRVVLLFPAFLSSLFAGGVAPFMTYIIGQVFEAFAKFPRDPNPPQAAKDTLLHNVGIGALGLIGLAVGSLAFSSVTSCLWIWLGERNVMAVRQQVYHAVARKEMGWYDTKMTSESTEDGPLGAGGLMARFTRDTDDVRMASSLASGMLVQYITTVIACLILGFIRSWALTLVILSSVPILMIIQGLSQALAGPPLSVERTQSGVGGTLIDRATNAIATVKAFNAARHEMRSFSRILATMSAADRKLNAVWGLTSGLSRFAMMAMFVQGFWFGGKLVREGRIAPGDVMAVFWACLIATSNLQMCIPQFILLAKGKFAMVSLLSLIDGDDEYDPNASPNMPPARSGLLRQVVPSRCLGELALHDVSFAYPSRPEALVLDNVSLYLPANETTFICGGSGSGKSTIAQLLLQLYTPQSGSIQLDDQDLRSIDISWARRQIAAVTQDCILFDMTVHANVAMGIAGVEGRRPEDVTRAEVIEACTAALLHDFIRGLPQGYDTCLGNGGLALSGGQRQRLAIARANLRNPPILVLDEATSALDPTSRVLVFEAIKRWRVGQTTVVITHDLSQISRNDFVYVLKDGRVAEQGYRYDLETSSGEFERMTVSHGVTGGFLPTKDVSHKEEDLEFILQQQELAPELRPFSFARDSMFPISNRLTMSNLVLGAASDHTFPKAQTLQKHQSSALAPVAEDMPRRRRRPSSIQITPLPPPPSDRPLTRRYSLEFEPTSPVSHVLRRDHEFNEKSPEESSQFTDSKRVRRSRNRWDEEKITVVTPTIEEFRHDQPNSPPVASLTFLQLMAEVYPYIPYKPLVVFGLFVCILSGAMTPVFSFLLSRLLHEVSIGAENYSYINLFGGIVLSVAAADGILMGAQFFLMETSAMLWVMRIRKLAFERVLAQDKKWFDKTEHSPVRLVQKVMKDGDDARNLIAVVLGQSVVVITMLSVGMIWALVRGWQLTLVGVAIGPVFAITMAFQSRLVATCELNNKRAREEVAKIYYETVSNIRGIRSMTLESVFERQFAQSTNRALSTGVQGAFVEGCTYGVASGLIYLSEALLFYVGAVLISRGTYTYLRMIEVLNLVVFTVTIGSQLLAFTEKIAKSVQATRDIHEILRLDTNSDESRGSLRPNIDGSVVFSNVSFNYPERPDVPVLKGLSLEIFAGESVAIVGTSGSGKTTLGALLQRLYEPKTGAIHVGGYDLRSTDVSYLRQHVGVVSQTPHLFDASISDNIVYGDDTLSPIDVRRAAKAAHAHDFIMNLPNGYDTTIGENASLISGGQAQRLQIARALARPSKILILDECTSALDSANQAAVMDAIFEARAGRTLLMITHKLPIMKQCDRIVLVHEGRIAEQGSFNELMARRGLFTTLLRGGEWRGD